MRRTRFFLLSLIFHFGFSGLLFFSSKKTDSARIEPIFQVEITERPSSATKAHEPASTKSGGTRTKSLQKFSAEKSFRKFLPSTDDFYARYDASSGQARQETEDPVKSKWTDPLSYLPENILLDGPSEEASRRRSFFGAIYQKIDRHLENDPLLSEYNQRGIVYIRFTLRADGSLVSSSLRASAENSILKVRSAKAIRKGLARPLLRSGLTDASQDISVTARFIWLDKSGCRSLVGAAGPFLSFCRDVPFTKKDFSKTGQAKSLAKIFLNPTTGPFAWKEELDKYNAQKWRHRTDFDPFEKERRDPDYRL
ncbi:MAG TPA: hypothetical protein PL182_08465 [Pseudobdellovibrionaceae bacterium]|nr:hypothetical protein [Pseudobdellovibrionaceae bacterium]